MRTMCGVQVKDTKIVENLMQTLGLNADIDQLAMTKCTLVKACVE